MKTILATILLFSFHPQNAGERYVQTRVSDGQYVHEREYVAGGYVDSLDVPNGYLDLRYEFDEQGFTVTVLGCKFGHVVCDSPEEFHRLVRGGKP